LEVELLTSSELVIPEKPRSERAGLSPWLSYAPRWPDWSFYFERAIHPDFWWTFMFYRNDRL